MEFADTPYGLIRAKRQPVLYIVRHGSTGDDDSYNSPENPKLDDEGRKDAAATGEFLRDKPLGDLIVSTSHRTKETGQIISKVIKREPQVSDRIDSLDVGDVTNLPSKEEADRVIRHHQEHKDETIPGGESLNNFDSRVIPEFMSSIKNFYKTGKPDVLVAHHSVQHAAGDFFNGNKDSALTKTGGVVAVYQVGPGKFEAVPIFRPEK